MARQEVNIGIEGNDGTGDSIRQSFKKVNENFIELYAVFGIGGRINFTTLSDTPDALIPNTVPFVNLAGTDINLVEFASDNELDVNLPDTVTFNYTVPGKIIVTSNFGTVGDDKEPILGGPLNGGGFPIGNIADPSTAALNLLKGTHPALSNLTVDDMVITKGYADRRFITQEIPLRPAGAPTGILHYSWIILNYDNYTVEIDSYYNVDQELQVGQGHGLTSSFNGLAVKFKSEKNDPNNLISGETYYIRYVTSRKLYLYKETEKQYATTTNQQDAEDFRVLVSGDADGADGTDIHRLTDAAYDETLSGNFLADAVVPRESVTLRSGDTMTGPLYLSDHPGELAGQGAPNGIEDLQAATKYYVDNTSYSSPEVLYVSTAGDDSMKNVPSGREGTAPIYAFKTINAAAQRAEELITAAPATLGPYIQRISYTENETKYDSLTIRAGIKFTANSQARKLIEENRKYIVDETIGYVAYNFPNFVYDIDICARDIGLIIDSIAFDVNKNTFANSLTIAAAQTYYASVSGRRAVTTQSAETTAAIAYARDLVTTAILYNQFYTQKDIVSISQAETALVTLSLGHGWNIDDNHIVIFKNVSGMEITENNVTTSINDLKLYAKVVDSTTFELYEDAEFETTFDTRSYTAHVANTGVIGVVFQLDEDQFFDNGEVFISDVNSGTTFANPILVTTSNRHFLDDNTEITISDVSLNNIQNGENAINTTLYAKRINDFTIGLYTAQFSPVEIINLTTGVTVTIITNGNHNLVDAQYITITGLNGATQLNNMNYYVKYIDDSTIELYDDIGLTDPVVPGDYAGSVIDAYINAGEITQFALDGRTFDTYNAGGIISKAVNAGDLQAVIADKFNAVIRIIEGGLEASDPLVYGSVYKIAITNGSGTGSGGGYVDQTAPLNTDVLPGKVVRGKSSNALGRVVRTINDSQPDSGVDPLDGSIETNPTVIEMHLLSPIDFEQGEVLEFANFIKKKEVVIRVEAGNYYEDFPIRLMNNVSLKGDEFRRVIVQPKNQGASNVARVSQSKYANTYFYRDNYFDGLQVARGGTPFYNQANEEIGKFGYHYLSDPTIPLNIGPTFANPGSYNNAALILKENKEYIVEETDRFLQERFPAVDYNRIKSKRDTGLIIDSLINDLTRGKKEGALEVQGSFINGLYDGIQEQACKAAMENIVDLASPLFLGTTPSYTIVDQTFDVISAIYDQSSGNLQLNIGVHTLTTDDYIELEPYSINFTCDGPENPVGGDPLVESYPSPTDPAYRTKIQINAVSATTITVNVGAPPDQGPGDVAHYFHSAESGAVTVGKYTAGSTEVTSVEKPKILNNILGETFVSITNPAAITVVDNLINTIVFVFDPAYNPPLRNDEVDMFLMGDTTIVRNLSCRGHGGFMCVLDPAGQILTKSPYIQTASSFSKSINRKIFAGGMFVDAYVGNLPTTIISVDYTSEIVTEVSQGNFVTGYLVLNVESLPGQGLRIRPPELPCPFYVEGRRFQVNAISDYDQAAGTAKLYLDATSNGNLGYAPDQFSDYNPLDLTRPIFLQTAGNRSILGNDYTQVNDLGYGLVCTNGAFSEMVSMFTYYTHAAYYAKNGAEIRSLNGSNGYGNFGLVAEGADPNEIPDQVTLVDDIVQPAKIYNNSSFSLQNNIDDPSIIVYDMKRPPRSDSQITIDHGGSIGVLNYRVNTVRNLSDLNNDGQHGESGDVVVGGILSSSTSAYVGGTPDDGYYTAIDNSDPANPKVIPIPVTGGSGTGAAVFVTITGGTRSYDWAWMGEGYQVGDQVRVSGSYLLYGGSPDSNAYININIGTVVAGTLGSQSNYVYQLDLRADTVFFDDYFGRIQEFYVGGVSQAFIPSDILIEYRDSFSVNLTGVTDVNRLVTRPSTAINFDESDNVTYRSINFQSQNSFGVPLPAYTTQATFEAGYDYVELETVPSEISVGWGDAGSTQIPVKPLTDSTDYADAKRIAADSRNVEQILQPGESFTNALGQVINYVSGMRFVYAGKTHAVTAYRKLYTIVFSNAFTFNVDDIIVENGTNASFQVVKPLTGTTVNVFVVANFDDFLGTNNLTNSTQSVTLGIPTTFGENTTWAQLTFVDVANSNVHPSPSPTGLNEDISVTDPKILVAGAHSGSTAEITIAISLCRATGHDFTQIGTGSYNDSNYPNVILGDPINPLAPYYSNAPEETAAQVWERRKGRVFFVSTDQYGFFRVGKFFEVDQGTGSITFAGEVGLSNANALGFKKGVVITEFSVDDGFVDDAADAVPTEKAVGGYIARVLGFNPKAANIVELANKIGPGVLPRNGALGMTGSLDMNDNLINNLANPQNDYDAVPRIYVETGLAQFSNLRALRDWSYNLDIFDQIIEPTENQVLVATGNYIIYTEPETSTGGTSQLENGIVISNATATKSGTVVKVITIQDRVEGAIRKIVYKPDTIADIFDTLLVGDSVINGSNGTTANVITSGQGGSYPEFVESSVNTASMISFIVSQTSQETTTTIDLKNGVITDTHVAANANIRQSKLLMNRAGVKADASSMSQDSLGLVVMDSTEFSSHGSITFSVAVSITANATITQPSQTVTIDGVPTVVSGFTAKAFATYSNTQTILVYDIVGNITATIGVNELTGTPTPVINSYQTGFIGLLTSTSTATGIGPEKLSWIGTDRVLGRSAAGTGAVSEVAFTTIVDEGGAVEDRDFAVYPTNNPPPEQVLTRTAYATYNTKSLIKDSDTALSVVQRRANGSIQAKSYIVGGDSSYEILAADPNSATTIQMKTPGQRVMIEASGSSASAVNVRIPDILTVGNAYIDPSAVNPVMPTTQSKMQDNTGTAANKGRSGAGWLNTNWILTKGIEAIDEHDPSNTTGTGIGFGDYLGFTEDSSERILFFCGGAVAATFDTTTTKIDTITSLSANTNLTLSGNGTGYVKVNDKLESTSHLVAGIGSGGPALTVNDGAGDANVTFNHTEGKPEQTGNSARIEVNTDSVSAASFNFELKSNVSPSTSAVIGLNTVFNLNETDAKFYVPVTPSSNNGQNLGTSSLNWGTLFVGNVDSDGDITCYQNWLPYVATGTVSAKSLGSSTKKWNTLHCDTAYATLFDGVASSAKYADLAENYLADDNFEPGTVVIFGGDEELSLTDTKGDRRVAGVISQDPAYLMNNNLEGKFVTPLALQGRVPCKVIGKVSKGDMLVTSAIPGYAIVDNDPRIGTVLGKAVGEKTDDGKGVVEIVVGRL